MTIEPKYENLSSLSTEEIENICSEIEGKIKKCDLSDYIGGHASGLNKRQIDIMLEITSESIKKVMSQKNERTKI